MKESESGWFLKHRDGVEHGPFLLADLIGAAAAGNIAADTVVKHATHSRDQWVIANRIPAISQATTSGSPDPSQRPATGPSAGSPSDATDRPQRTPKQSPQVSDRSPSAARGGQNAPAGSATKSTGQTQPPMSTRTQPARSQQVPASASSATPPVTTPRHSPPARPQSPASTVRQPTAQPTALPTQNDDSASVSETKSAKVSNEPGFGASVPEIRGGRENPFPVPKTFLDACLALFDFRFRFFITPWIIKIVWAMCVTIAMLSIVKLGYDAFIQPSIAEDARTSAATSGWQFEPLEGESLWRSSTFRFVMAVFGIGLMLVITRVICEACIVFFHVANHVNDLRRIMKERAE
ncbi:MAG: DUF4282 domain-containing protein [Rubripirellula sp.]